MFRAIKNIFTKDYPALDAISEGFAQVATALEEMEKSIQEYKEKREIEIAEEFKLHKIKHEEKLKLIEVEHDKNMMELKQKEDLLVQEHNKENGTKFTHIDEVIEANEIKFRAISDILDDFYDKK